MVIQPIGIIRSPISSKFGAPRQSGLAEVKACVILKEPFNREEALRGLEGFSHIWLLWEFSETEGQGWTPTVRPPKLGGNTRMGVFATRSPFRPNPIGLSCVRLASIQRTDTGPVLNVIGADLIDGTPIIDIKPYLSYTDSKPDAACGYAQELSSLRLEVEADEDMLKSIEDKQSLITLLSLDPRPGYSDDPQRIYGMEFERKNIKFTVKDGKLTVIGIEAL